MQQLQKLKIVNVYKDPQLEEEIIGKAILLEHLRDGLPFILNEDDTYCLQEWEAIDLDTGKLIVVEVRKEITKYRVPSGYKKQPIKSYENYLVDKFLVFHGIEMF